MKVQQGTAMIGGFELNYAGYSDVGRARECNEDDFLIMPEQGVFCVADGVGGLEAGDVAAQLALHCIQLMFHAANFSLWAKVQALLSRREKKSLLEESILLANSRVFMQKDEGRRNMAATLAAVQLVRKKAILAHVGDCRVYLFRDNTLSVLTNDHSLVAELYMQGAISYDQVKNHPYRHVVTRAVGAKPKVSPAIQQIEVNRGDTLLLCSDGLTGMLTDQELSTIITRFDTDVGAAGDALVQAANQRGGKDNITVVLLHLR